MSWSSASVGFWPRLRITVPSSLVVMVPSPSLSKSENASLNSCSRHLRVHPGRPLPVRFRSYHRPRPRHWRWCCPRRPHLRGLRPSPCHLASRLGRTRLDRLPHEDHVRERILHGDHCRARDRS